MSISGAKLYICIYNDMRKGEKQKKKETENKKREREYKRVFVFTFVINIISCVFMNNPNYIQKSKETKFFLFYTIGQHAGKREIHDNQYELLFLVRFGPVHPMLNDTMVLLNKNIFVNSHSEFYSRQFHHHFHHQIYFQDHIEDH